MTDLKNRRASLFKNQGGACYYCTRVYESAIRGTIDHVVPRSRGGSNRRDNTVWSCRQCNVAKGDKLPDDPRWLKTRARLTALATTLRGSPFMPKADRTTPTKRSDAENPHA